MEESKGQDQQAGQAQQAAEQAREKVGEATQQAKEQARSLGGQAQDRIREQVDERSTQAGERVGGTAADVRSVGEQLRNQGKDGPARIAEQAADRIDRAGTYLRESDADRILSDVEDFGRSRPWAVFAGAVFAGFAAARFLKASSRERYSSRQSYASADRPRPQLETPTRGTSGTGARGPTEQVGTPVGAR